ncbi:MAG: hypothetical protein JSV92_00505 [archaeon]|nr:MAG: hypothetical protein JSV92_00505 [archaeon]
MIRKALKKILEGEDPGPEPKNDYIVGISTGIPKEIPTPAGRLGFAMSKGVEFVELALEHPVSVTKREVDEIKRIKERMGIKLGMHAGFEAFLTSPYDIDYTGTEDQLKLYIEAAAKTKTVYIDFHACVLARPRMYSIPRRYDFLVDENGDNIMKKITKKTPKLWEWFFEDFMPNHIGRLSYFFPEDIKEEIAKIDNRINTKEISIEEGRKEYKKLEKKGIEKALKSFQESKFKQPWRDRGTEEYAFELMGRWMWETKDPLWKTYCGGKSYEDAEEKDLVAAVSAKYVTGHLKKHLETLEDKNVIIALESPDARGGQYAGYYRLQTTTQIYHLVKHINSPQVRILIDFEHLATQGIDPMKDVEKAPGDVGRYTVTLHVGTIPMPAHAHAPSPRGDIYIYTLLWKLRQKGLKNAIFIFERGGMEAPKLYEQIVITLKDVAKYLSQDIPPGQLPEEYFGLTQAEIEHEKRVVDSHAFDPLQGMFELPELSHTWLGREAMEKKRVRTETWKKEEHR